MRLDGAKRELGFFEVENGFPVGTSSTVDYGIKPALCRWAQDSTLL